MQLVDRVQNRVASPPSAGSRSNLWKRPGVPSRDVILGQVDCKRDQKVKMEGPVRPTLKFKSDKTLGNNHEWLAYNCEDSQYVAIIQPGAMSLGLSLGYIVPCQGQPVKGVSLG